MSAMDLGNVAGCCTKRDRAKAVKTGRCACGHTIDSHADDGWCLACQRAGGACVVTLYPRRAPARRVSVDTTEQARPTRLAPLFSPVAGVVRCGPTRIEPARDLGVTERALITRSLVGRPPMTFDDRTRSCVAVP